jgi:hypothetical protein
MAQPFVPGPCPVWVGFGDGLSSSEHQFTPKFLGFTQRGVDFNINPEYSPFTTDIGGRVPADLIFDGTGGTVSLDLTRWNEPVYAMLADHAPVGLDNRVRGSEPAGRVGTIMGIGGAAVAVYAVFPYQVSPNYRTMPVGYRFLRCVLDREGLPERGSKPARLLLTFRCLRGLRPALLRDTPFPDEGEEIYKLYDHDLSALAGLFPD